MIQKEGKSAMYPGLTLNGIDNVLEKLRSGDHRSPQPEQKEIDLGQATSSSSLKTENSKLKTPAWPERLPVQVTLIRHLLATNPGASAEELSTYFGRKNAKRTEQIDGIVETLRGIGKA